MKLLLIGGEAHGEYHEVSNKIVLDEDRFQLMEEPLTHPVSYKQTSPVEVFYKLHTYEVVPVIRRGKVVDYYGKDVNMCANESFEVYKSIKAK